MIPKNVLKLELNIYKTVLIVSYVCCIATYIYTNINISKDNDELQLTNEQTSL